MRGSFFFVSLLLGSSHFTVSENFRPGIPEKSWAIRGYEAFNSPDRKPKSAKEATKVPSSPPKNAVTQKEGSGSAPDQATKAVVGIGAAVLVAAFGGSVLATEPKPHQALVEAIKKPLIPVPPLKVKPEKKVKPAGATIPNEGNKKRTCRLFRLSILTHFSIPNEVFNLMKAIVGVGVLSLPAGVATFGSAPSAFIPAGIAIAVIGILSGYGFSLIGKVCAYTGKYGHEIQPHVKLTTKR